jgi:ornithine cyclodeaminase/alanine dehydrogenase-like protein (mu-crystallin family)
MRVIGADELRSALSMTAAIDALGAAFANEDPSLASPMRTTMATAAGTLLTMPAAGDAGVGVKLVTLSEFNPQKGLPFVQATYVLFDVDTQRPEAVIDGTELTAIRTAAVSGLATRFLARVDAARLIIFGAGVQATSHLEAMCAVRPVTDVVVVSRRTEPAEALAAKARALGVTARVGMADDVATADLVCTCTTSSVSVFPGEDLPAGAHVNAVGASLPDRRELDTEAIRRAKVVVETRREALAEAGELLIPIGEGVIDASHIRADLTDLARGVVVRTDPSDITVFKSVGMAFEDLVVARAALDALG